MNDHCRLTYVRLLDVDALCCWLRSDSAADSGFAAVHRLDKDMVAARRAVERHYYQSTDYPCENQSL